jgi:hypothetical protein
LSPFNTAGLVVPNMSPDDCAQGPDIFVRKITGGYGIIVDDNNECVRISTAPVSPPDDFFSKRFDVYNSAITQNIPPTGGMITFIRYDASHFIDGSPPAECFDWPSSYTSPPPFIPSPNDQAVVTIQCADVYLITYRITCIILGAANASTITSNLYLNGVIVPGTVGKIFLRGAGTEGTSTVTLVLPLAIGDQLMVGGIRTGAGMGTVQTVTDGCSLTITKV